MEAVVGGEVVEEAGFAWAGGPEELLETKDVEWVQGVKQVGEAVILVIVEADEHGADKGVEREEADGALPCGGGGAGG